ncbi:MAG: YihY/virulence factor BrkB family protein [Sphingomonas sp.]|uniref:YihY/virulence factor BrkB family protein n=1 Tax=Sphingomonas sp. 67-41 TaxID=1895850 RepID=UPI0014219A2D|nr:YihY/virulence factor BrkB family protein [Sphingomonas sp. 67-41]MBN8810311.1 YihY/virulence factor BrkB family protein [Sphingomonas sp.]
MVKRVLVGTFQDGFTYAGNLAYLSLVTLFPFFIVAAAIAQLIGRSSEGIHTLDAFLRTVPPDVAELLRKPVSDVLMARTGNLLWFGAIVGLWTVAGFIETIRGILRQAYGVRSGTPFWQYRLGAIGMIIASVIITMAAFSFQVILTAVEQFLYTIFPWASEAQRIVSLSKIAPAIALFGALYILFYSLTPGRYRKSRCPKWPGALFTAAWWLLVTALLPKILGTLGNYDLTYGSLAGVMIALIFFFLVGLGLVVGAELNAALAETPENGLEEPRERENTPS